MTISRRSVVALLALLVVARVEPALAQSWAGSFVGLTAGYGSGHSTQTDSGIPPALPPLGDASFRVDGALAGATLGFNWQQGPWVFGLEGDYSWAGISGSSPLCAANTASLEVQQMGSRDRLQALSQRKFIQGMAQGMASFGTHFFKLAVP